MSEQSMNLAKGLKAALDILNELVQLNLDEQSTYITYNEAVKQLETEEKRIDSWCKQTEQMSSMGEFVFSFDGEWSDGGPNPENFFIGAKDIAAAKAAYKKALRDFYIPKIEKEADAYDAKHKFKDEKEKRLLKAERDKETALAQIFERRTRLVEDFFRGPYMQGDYPLDYAYPSAAEWFLHEASANNVDTMEKCMNNYRTKQYRTEMAERVEKGFDTTLRKLDDIDLTLNRINLQLDRMSSQIEVLIDGQKQIIDQNDVIVHNQMCELSQNEQVMRMMDALGATVVMSNWRR